MKDLLEASSCVFEQHICRVMCSLWSRSSQNTVNFGTSSWLISRILITSHKRVVGFFLVCSTFITTMVDQLSQ